jgi:hypothetical protein
MSNRNLKRTSNRTKSKKQIFTELYQAIYVANIKGLVDENRYIKVLQSISENGFKTYHIDNFDKLTIHLKKLKLNKSYTISILLYLRDSNYRKIIEASNYFKDVRKILSTKNKKKMVEKIIIVNKILNHKLIVAKAFVKNEKVESIYYGGIQNTKLDDTIIKNEWFHYNRQDIINRLHNLIEIFTLDQLKYIGIELIRSDVLNNTNTVDLQAYYNRTILKIISTLKNWKKICRLYIDVDFGYLKACKQINLNRNVSLNMKMFTINFTKKLIKN